MENYDAAMAALLPLIGGAENVERAWHCLTRLHFKLIDVERADRAAIARIPGIIGTVRLGREVQAVVGVDVHRAFAAYERLVAGDVGGDA